eukprot:272975-Pelagomonas_calceolata.AAC.5
MSLALYWTAKKLSRRFYNMMLACCSCCLHTCISSTPLGMVGQWQPNLCQHWRPSKMEDQKREQKHTEKLTENGACKQ